MSWFTAILRRAAEADEASAELDETTPLAQVRDTWREWHAWKEALRVAPVALLVPLAAPQVLPKRRDLALRIGARLAESGMERRPATLTVQDPGVLLAALADAIDLIEQVLDGDMDGDYDTSLSDFIGARIDIHDTLTDMGVTPDDADAFLRIQGYERSEFEDAWKERDDARIDPDVQP